MNFVSKAKYSFAALALAGAALCSLPAAADPYWVSNVQVPSGGFNIGVNVNGSATSFYYAGIIAYTINPGMSYDSTSTLVLDTFCDDLNHEVGIGSSEQYYTDDADTYLAPLGATLTHDIAGLAYYGLANSTNAQLDEEVQLAIWEIEYQSENITATDAGLQADVATLIAGDSADYSAMLAAGFTYGEFESPGCGLTDGTITFEDCQIQGQIYIYPSGLPPPNLEAPEPLTLSLFGAGLLGAAGMRRRRKADKAA
jgi:hypothetical protein